MWAGKFLACECAGTGEAECRCRGLLTWKPQSESWDGTQGTLCIPQPLLLSLAWHPKVGFVLKLGIFLVPQHPCGWSTRCVMGATDNYLGSRWDQLTDWLFSAIANEINVVFT